MLNKNEGVSMPFLTLVIILLAIAAIISLVFSFLGILLVGALRLLPIGGYCAMEGEDEEASSDNPRAFGNAAGWRR